MARKRKQRQSARAGYGVVVEWHAEAVDMTPEQFGRWWAAWMARESGQPVDLFLGALESAQIIVHRRPDGAWVLFFDDDGVLDAETLAQARAEADQMPIRGNEWRRTRASPIASSKRRAFASAA